MLVSIFRKIRFFKFLLSIFLIFFILHNSHSQTVNTEVKVNPSLKLNIKVTLENKVYTINLSSDDEEINETTSFTNFTSTSFRDFVLNTVKSEGINLSANEINEFRQRISVSYLEIMSSLMNVSREGQKIATIELKNSMEYWEKSKLEGKKNAEKGKKDFELGSCQIVFENGFIEKVIVTGKIDKKRVSFSNKFSIGITTRKNIQHLTGTALFEEHVNNRETLKFIYLGNAIIYDRILDLYTNDFSPADQVITLFPGKKQHLYKSSSNKLFKFNVFSDLAGINEDNPNGLVQTELSKRINLSTKREDFVLGSGIGMFTHLSLSLVISKIEENNRYLPVSQGNLVENNVSNSIYYVSPLEIYRYSTARFVTEVSVFDIESASFALNLNSFIGYALTNVRDTLDLSSGQSAVSTSINSSLSGFNTIITFNPEKIWSFQISNTLTFVNPLAHNENFVYKSNSKGYLYNDNKWINSLQFLIRVDMGNDNNLFGRIRINQELGESSNNFSQWQVGYSMLLKSKNEKK